MPKTSKRPSTIPATSRSRRMRLHRPSLPSAVAKFGTSLGASGVGIFQSASALEQYVGGVGVADQRQARRYIYRRASDGDYHACLWSRIRQRHYLQYWYCSDAQGAGEESVKLTNLGGTISIFADAKAQAHWSANATANALLHGGIAQHAFVSSGTASIALSNAGNIAIVASARAFGWNNARASADLALRHFASWRFPLPLPILVSSIPATSPSPQLRKRTPPKTMPPSMPILAQVFSNRPWCTAQRSWRMVDRPTFSSDNSGKILIEAFAHVTGRTGASATATVVNGIEQFARDGDIVSAKLTGAGTVSMLASAFASVSDPNTATVLMPNWPRHLQKLIISSLASGSALASISIGGGKVEAYAKAVGDTAKATGQITQYGIFQQVDGPRITSRSSTNR